MAMMISKFHKLIQSRIIWIIIAVVIVFSFIIWAMPWPAREEMAAEARHAGEMFGEKISFEEFRMARANTYLSLAMMMGRVPRLNDQMNTELNKSAWRRLASLRKAKELGFSASNEEVIQSIKTQPIFQDNGQYNAQRYQAFVMNFLRQLGISETQFENYVRQEIVLQKLRNMVAQTLIISPFEIQRTFDTVNDVFDVEYVMITPDDIEDRINVTEDDIQSYFEENRDSFMIPPKVSVKYVRFPLSDFTDGIEIPEEEALAYYDDNIDEYTTIVEKEEIVEDEETESSVDALAAELDTESETVITPFDEVKEQINEVLTTQKARIAASDKATAMVLGIANANGNLSFEDAAAKFGVSIKTTEPFAANEPIEGIDAGPLFNQDCFQLSPNPDEYFSNAIMGKEYVYVAALDKQYDERLPELPEVYEDVEQAVEVDALVQALTDASNEMQEAAEKAVSSDDGSFADVAKANGYDVNTITNVSVMTGIEDDETLTETIVPAVLTYNQDEVTEPIPTEEGVIVAYVAKRTPGTMASVTALKPQIVDALKRERRPYMFRDWEDYLLDQGGFVDNMTVVQEEVEETPAQDS